MVLVDMASKRFSMSRDMMEKSVFHGSRIEYKVRNHNLLVIILQNEIFANFTTYIFANKSFSLRSIDNALSSLPVP